MVRRTRSGIARRPSNSFFVNVQLAGQCAVQTGDGEALLLQGDIIVLDADSPFCMQFDRSFRQACLHLERTSLGGNGAVPTSVLRGSQSRARRIWCELSRLHDEPSPQDTLASVSSLLAETTETRRRHDLSMQHLMLIKAHISERCDDPGLGAARVASHFRISKRHLHSLFARSGETFGQYLIYRRLRSAQRRISAAPDVSLSQIASESGFKTVSHFSRSFVRQFGLSPRRWRQAIK